MKIKEDLAELRPTVFPSVPRLWSRMYDVIQATFKEAEGTKAKLIKSALETKLKNLRKNGKTTHALWDSLVFKKTAKVLGGKMENMKRTLRSCMPASAPRENRTPDPWFTRPVL